jgi:hypothetical protein
MVSAMRIVLPAARVVGILWAALGASLWGLQIEGYNSLRHDRFVAGTFPEAPIVNPDLWAAAYDFAGVGWSEQDPAKGFALITPQHFVGANHFKPPLGSPIRFVGRDGQVRIYTVAKFYQLKNGSGEDSDIFVGELTAPIPADHGVPLYPMLDLPESALVGRSIVVYGRGFSEPRVGRGKVKQFADAFPSGITLNATRNYSFEHVNRTAALDDCYGEIGDSGSPSFFIVDGMLAVAGTHAAIQQVSGILGRVTTTTFDSYVPHYRVQIDQLIAATGYRTTLAPVGEDVLSIRSIQLDDDQVTLSIANPSGAPYDVQRAADLAGSWETVQIAATGEAWTGPVPEGAERMFWRLMRYPLPAVAP